MWKRFEWGHFEPQIFPIEKLVNNDTPSSCKKSTIPTRWCILLVMTLTSLTTIHFCNSYGSQIRDPIHWSDSFLYLFTHLKVVILTNMVSCIGILFLCESHFHIPSVKHKQPFSAFIITVNAFFYLDRLFGYYIVFLVIRMLSTILFRPWFGSLLFLMDNFSFSHREGFPLWNLGLKREIKLNFWRDAAGELNAL